MRHTIFPAMIAICALSAVSGCKVVKNPDPEAENAQTEDQSDAARMAAYAAEIWEPQVLPTVAEHLVPLTQLRTEFTADPDAAGAAHGLRPEGEANPWNFAVSGSGTVIEDKSGKRAAKLLVDTTGDGVADVTLQMGPVIRGTALRDAMPFFTFSDFRDQIEFAKLAGGLNTMAHQGITFPTDDVTGQTVTFEGVFTMHDIAKSPEIVTTTLTYAGQ